MSSRHWIRTRESGPLDFFQSGRVNLSPPVAAGLCAVGEPNEKPQNKKIGPNGFGVLTSGSRNDCQAALKSTKLCGSAQIEREPATPNEDAAWARYASSQGRGGNIHGIRGAGQAARGKGEVLGR
jgi:hypothetical protein